MSLLLPAASTVTECGAELLDKWNMNRTKITAFVLTRWVFTGMALALTVYAALARAPLPALSPAFVVVLVAIVGVSVVGNLASYASLAVNDVSLRQPLLGSVPIVAAGVGMIWFPAERSWPIGVGLCVAAVVVWWGSTRRSLGAAQRRGIHLLILTVAAHATMPTLYKLAQAHATAGHVALLRVLGVLTITTLLAPPRRGDGAGTWGAVQGMASGAIYAAATVLGMLAIDKLGVAQTMMLMLAAPLLNYLLSHLVLRERFKWGEVAASVALAAIAVTATTLHGA